MPYQLINTDEQLVIQHAHDAGESFLTNGRMLGRSHWCISLDWARNQGANGYQAHEAQYLAKARACQPIHSRRYDRRPLRETVFR